MPMGSKEYLWNKITAMTYILLEEYAGTTLSVDLNEWRKMMEDPSFRRKLSNFYYKKEFNRLKKVIKDAVKEGKIIVVE